MWWCMTLLQALILGIVEGVTEFLPVSSTGHLLLAERALGIPRSEAADAYVICIQAGAIVAVLGLYRARMATLVKGVMGRDSAGLRLLIQLMVAFVPAAVLGLLFEKKIDEKLLGLWPVVIAWAVGGVVILALRGRRTLDGRPVLGGTRALGEIDMRTALLIGLAQCLALWPGTSRSLATILAGLALGLSVPAAVEFSFLLGLETLGAATAYKALKHGPEMVDSFGLAPIAVGFVAAAISAAISVKWLVQWLQSHGMEVFAVWRLVLAVVVAGLLASGVLSAA